MASFTHLHVHTQYSILDGASSIDGLIQKTKDSGMNAIAITDHGNMYGVLQFYECAKKNQIKPILGCEVYITDKSRLEKKTKDDRSGYHLILLAKNHQGYKNLSKLVSNGFIEGFYYTPRIDFEILKQYSEGLIACSACLGGEIPKNIMKYNNIEKGFEKSNIIFNFDKIYPIINKYVEIFKDDFYFELQNHGLELQKFVNKALIELSKELNIKCIATNDVHFVNKEDFEAHTILVCLNTGRELEDSEGLHYTGNEYLRTPEEMLEQFKDYPQAIENTQEITDKIEDYKLEKDVVLPVFSIPDNFNNESEYLEHLTWEGANKRWTEITPEIKERIDFELNTIKNMGFPGYFLITWDFINEARKMGVRVGPGRGSAAGSAVAYCLGITNIDPIKYLLLFERFLNPERISMPDVDIDFDDEGREKVLKYVIDKYGKERVSQIITFGTMAARSAIKDVARVLKLPLAEANRLSKLIPETAKIEIKNAINQVPELKEELVKGADLVKKTLKFAMELEGSIRNVGVHACGVIIGRDDLTNYAPISKAKDSEMNVTQYEGTLVEKVGLLKMDFLGLKTLSIINDTITNIKISKKILDFDIDNIPLDDENTYQIFSRGETTAIFQFESAGMKKYLLELKPNRFEDIIAMNALYRPGPMQYIPNFINRKYGREKIEYPYPIMEKYLSDTYGITVYQEQVMLLSQAMAGFTKGQADTLRKAMGKKMADVMYKLKNEFIDGCKERGMEKNIVEKIWTDWEVFADYAFNKSHSTCYSYVAYQTAYLKAHFPAEFMAANLTNNLSKIDEISKFIDECKRMKINVLGPDINESQLKFTVNPTGEIRFGMGAIKNVGESAVESIVEERQKNGNFKSIFDFVQRINLKALNKRCLESLAKAGAFDSFENIHRAQYLDIDKENINFIEKLIKYATVYQDNINSSQVSIFDSGTSSNQLADPTVPYCEPWSPIEKLKFEKEVTGFFISGHPLDNYSLALKYFCNIELINLKANIQNYINREVTFGGMITEVQHAIAKNGNPYGRIKIEDYTDNYQITIFKEEYLKFKHLFQQNMFLYFRASISIPTWKKENNPEPEIKLNEVILLSDVVKKYCKIISVDLPLINISKSKIEQLETIAKENNGNCSLKFKITHENHRPIVLSSKYKINTETFLTFLKSLNYTYQLN